jgi:acetate kinase
MSRVLVINTGSSSIKYQLFEMPEGSGEPQGGAPVDREGSGEPQGGAPVDREGA